MNVVKDLNNSVQKLKVHSQVESKLNYANNAFNMELDILIVRKMKVVKKCMKPRKLMRDHIQNSHGSFKNNKIMENNGDDIDFVVEFPDKDGNSFHAPSMADQNEMKMNEISFLHANPEVQMFNDGELNHSVATCLTCHETRTQFHTTKPSEKFHTENRKPHEVPSWVIY